MGTQSESGAGNVTVESRMQFEGTVAPADLSRVTDARQKFRIGIYGTSSMYAGASARVTSEAIGRDVNPLGRGDGQAYVGGSLNLGELRPALPLNAGASGSGNSVNNDPQVGTNELERAEHPEGGVDLGGVEYNADVGADPKESVDMDEVMKIFEVPEMDEETRILYITGMLGGPTSPYQILPAYSPDAQMVWQYFLAMSQAWSDALAKIAEGEYNAMQVRAYIFIAEMMLANYLTGIPLAVTNVFGGLSPLGGALLGLETGEMIIRKLPPVSPGMGNIVGYDDAEEEGTAEETPEVAEEDTRTGWQKAWDAVKDCGRKVADFLGFVANDISNRVSAMAAKAQDTIDVAGEFYFGEKWTKMRETVNFENEYITGAIELASWFVCPVAIGVRLAALAFKAFKVLSKIGKILRYVGKFVKGVGRFLGKAARGLGKTLAKNGVKLAKAIRGRMYQAKNRIMAFIGRVKNGQEVGSYLKKATPLQVSPGLKRYTHASEISGNQYTGIYDDFGRLVIEDHTKNYRGSSAYLGPHYHLRSYLSRGDYYKRVKRTGNDDHWYVIPPEYLKYL